MLSLSLCKYGNENIMLSLFAFKFYGCIKIRKQMQLVFFLIFVSALVYLPCFRINIFGPLLASVFQWNS